jgi:hypothetical protein
MPAMKTKAVYVLCPLPAPSGPTRFFRAMTSMGPACTESIYQAAKFGSSAEAEASPACQWPGVEFVPGEVVWS